MRRKLIASDVAKILPRIVRDRLRAALTIHPGVDLGGSRERTQELDRVTQQARMQFPQYFQPQE